MKILRTLGFLVAVAAAFFGGYVYKAIKGSGQTSVNSAGRKILYWVDPMHPAYKSDKPGIAPDCGMKLEPVYTDGSGPSADSAGARKVRAEDLSAMPVGTVQITPEKQQLIGVKYGYVENSGGSRTIRSVGKVAFDETRIQHIHTKVEGWIDQVFVDYTGQLVKKGQPLLTVYSPDMLASQRELLLAAKARDSMKNNPLPIAFDQSESLLQAARRRLELWDLSEAQIDQVLKTGQPIKNVTLYAPIGGYVTDRKAFPQLKVMPETDLYTLVDLSGVWIMADLFEYEAPNIHVGDRARVSLRAVPGKIFFARINYIQPQVDPTTRTLKVRLDMDNPGLILKPDMYANVEFQVNFPVQLTVPAEALLDAGERKTVFVDRGDGFFEPRQVTTGERDGSRIQILSGLRAGERIVTSGNFLIDSESQMKAAAAGMGGMAGMPGMTNEPMNKPKGQEAKPADRAMPDMPNMPGMGGKKQ
jgi:RND family efflux transporter MFP subunit